MKTTKIKEGYTENLEVPEFDDTELHEQWQHPVYLFARGAYEWGHFRTVIDVGCGSAYKLVGLFPHEEGHDQTVIGVETNKNTLDYLRRTLSPRGFWVTPNVLDEFVDTQMGRETDKELLCICSDVIEHVEDPVQFMEWLIQIPWQQMVISTPDRNLGSEPDGPPGNIHHFREWSFSEFREFLGQFPEFGVKLHCLIHPEQRTQMAWLERTSSVTQDETESPSDEGHGGSTSGSASLCLA